MIVYLLLLSVWILTALAPESSNIYTYIIFLCQGKPYFSLILLCHLLVVRFFLYEPDCFVRIRTPQSVIVKQNVFNLVLSISGTVGITLIWSTLLYAVFYSRRIPSLEMFVMALLLGVALLFISLLVASLFFYLLTTLIDNFLISFGTFIILLNISAFFPASALYWLADIFQYREDRLADFAYVQGQTLMMVGQSILALIIASVIFNRKEYLGGSSHG